MFLYPLSMSVIILMIILFITKPISSYKMKHREKSSPFECGFDPASKSRTPFSLSFFLLAVVFLVFDVEVALILPIPTLIKVIAPSNFLLPTAMFIMFLMVSLIHEWNEGSLFWVV